MAGEGFRFGPFFYDRRRTLLTARGAPISVGTRALVLLDALLEARGGVVTRAELINAAWPDTAIEDSNLTVQIAALRKSLAELGAGEEWISTVPRIGYRFAGSIEVGEQQASHRAPQGVVKGRRSIAVLPFRNLSNDPEQSPFCDGLSEDLITDLSKVPGMTVIARNSSFALRGRDARSIGVDLGVNYVVDGSVRRDRHRVRINAELTDAAEATQIWADRFDGDLDDIFRLQDDVVGKIVTALSGAIPRPAAGAKWRAANVDAYDRFVRGRALVMQSEQDNIAARTLLEAAIDKDPEFAAAHAWLAVSHYAAWAMWGEGLDGTHRTPALASATRAASLDGENADAAMILGSIYAFDGDLDRGDAELSRAIRLNPNHADALVMLADLRVFQGRADEAVESVERAFRLNPYSPRVYYWTLGFANYAARRYEDAVEALRREATYRTGSQRILAAALAQLGRIEEARREAAEFLSRNPDFRARSWADAHPFRDLADREHFVEGYLKAGLPTD